MSQPTTRTARRRWSRELESVIDGIAFGPSGPVLVHVYDPPAGGMWLDDVIPGKLGALDRRSGEVLWLSPCEVGYGRGFGAGLIGTRELVVLGPSSGGHRAVRMALDSGRLVEATDIEPFDDALVHEDLCLCVTAGRVFALSSTGLTEAWEHAGSDERYHHLARVADSVFVSYSHAKTGKQGVLCLDAESGEVVSEVLAPRQPVIHGLAASPDGLTVLTSDLEGALPREVLASFLVDIAAHDEEAARDTLSLLTVPLSSEPGDAPLWYEILSTGPADDVPEVAITSDGAKLYLVRGALLEVRDVLTGRRLGEWAVPGLDERVAWKVSEGAALLAEEGRVSVFELPA